MHVCTKNVRTFRKMSLLFFVPLIGLQSRVESYLCEAAFTGIGPHVSVPPIATLRGVTMNISIVILRYVRVMIRVSIGVSCVNMTDIEWWYPCRLGYHVEQDWHHEPGHTSPKQQFFRSSIMTLYGVAASAISHRAPIILVLNPVMGQCLLASPISVWLTTATPVLPKLVKQQWHGSLSEAWNRNVFQCFCFLLALLSVE